MYSHGHDQIVVKLRQTPLCLYCGITVRLWCGVTVHLWTIKGRWTTVDTYPYSQIIILDYKYVIAKSSWSFKGSAVRIKGNKPKKKKRSKTKKEKKCTKFESTVFPWIIAGGNYFFFHIRRGRLFEGGDYFKYCSLEVKPLNILFYYPIELKKIITSNKLNMGFLSVPNLVPWLISVLNIRAWIVTDQTPLQLCLLSKLSIFNLTGREGIKKREDGERVCEEINRGTVIIRGRRYILLLLGLKNSSLYRGLRGTQRQFSEKYMFGRRFEI